MPARFIAQIALALIASGLAGCDQPSAPFSNEGPSAPSSAPAASNHVVAAPGIAAAAGLPADAGRSSGVDAGASSGGLDPEIVAALTQVSAPAIAANIQSLVAFQTRNSCSSNSGQASGIGAARDFIAQQFQALNLKTALDPFALKCAAGQQTDQNVLAWLPGSGHPDRIFVVCGHYDSRTLNVDDGASAAPGANDSGSQTALVLEVAKVLAPLKLDATILFVAFAGEEQGLLGSKHLATNYPQYVPGAVEAALNSDIVGGDNTVNSTSTLQQFRLYSAGTPREIASTDGTTDDTSPSRGVMRHIAYWGKAYVPSLTLLPELREDRIGRGGDQESFLDQGLPGVRFIETVESPNAGTLSSHEHSPNDLFQYVTPDYTARIAQVVAAEAATLARGPGAPQMPMVSGDQSSASISWLPPATGSAVDHYVIAARPVTENFYRARIAVASTVTSQSITPADLGIDNSAFYISVAALDSAGHESLFAYPEYRCDASQCVVPPGSLDVTTRN